MENSVFSADWRNRVFDGGNLFSLPGAKLIDLLSTVTGPQLLMNLRQAISKDSVPVTHLVLGECSAYNLLNNANWFLMCLDKPSASERQQNALGVVFGMQVHMASELLPLDIFCYSEYNKAVSYMSLSD